MFVLRYNVMTVTLSLESHELAARATGCQPTGSGFKTIEWANPASWTAGRRRTARWGGDSPCRGYLDE